MKRLGPGRNRKIVVAVFILLIVLYLYFAYNAPLRFEYVSRSVHMPCVLPRLDPFDRSVMEFYKRLRPIQCSNSLSLLYLNSSGILQMNMSAVVLTGHTHLKCSYHIVERIDDYHVRFGPEVTITQPTYVSSDVIYVKCFDDKNYKLYEHVLQNVDYKRIYRSKTLKDESKEQLSVILFGIDSLSRLAAERYLPLTMKYLKEILHAHIFEGYTKIGEATFHNIISTFTNKFAFSNELPSYKGYLDNYPFIWKNFSEKGYVTYHIEDWARLSTFALYKGFLEPPFDHYMRPYYHAVDKIEKPLLDESVNIFLENQNLNLHRKYSSFCYRSLPKHQIMIDNLKRFIHVYRNKLKLSFTWLNELGHEYSNTLQYADSDIKEFFKWLKQNGVLEKSVLIFYSDHGLKTGGIRNTVQGRIEDFMPLMTVVIPKYLNIAHPKAVVNLSQNTQRLTMPFDLYETLKDVLLSDFDDFRHGIGLNTQQRGISFFKHIPSNRSCHEASITNAFCPCYTSNTISLDDPFVHKIGSFIANKLNEYLANHRHKCAKISISNIISAEALDTNIIRAEHMEHFSFWKYLFKPKEKEKKYLIRVQTIPGDALYETLVLNSDGGYMHIIDDVIRINKYGNQSACIKDAFLRSYCFCK